MGSKKVLPGKNIRRWLMITAIIVSVCCLIRLAGNTLNPPESVTLQKQAVVNPTYNQLAYVHAVDSLQALYGKNKRLILKYKLQTLLALSHYPELKNTHIHFYEEEALIPLASRPEPGTMFGSKTDWQYNVIISTKSLDLLEPVLVKNLPFNAQVGIIGHELAHTTYYLDKNIWQMLVIGLNYPFPGFRADFEKNTDRRTVAHGLGFQLLEYARYARKVIEYEETSLGSEYYLSPEEIEAQMKQTY